MIQKPLKFKVISSVLISSFEDQMNDWVSNNDFELVDINYYVKDKIFCFILYKEIL